MNKSADFGENKLEDCKKYDQKVYTTEIMPTQKVLRGSSNCLFKRSKTNSIKTLIGAHQ